MQAGERLMQKEIDEYHRQGLEGSDEHKTPLSPTTHTVLPEESPYHQRETFVWSEAGSHKYILFCCIYLPYVYNLEYIN